MGKKIHPTVCGTPDAEKVNWLEGCHLMNYPYFIKTTIIIIHLCSNHFIKAVSNSSQNYVYCQG